jgi:hypothetical protein
MAERRPGQSHQLPRVSGRHAVLRELGRHRPPGRPGGQRVARLPAHLGDLLVAQIHRHLRQLPAHRREEPLARRHSARARRPGGRCPSFRARRRRLRASHRRGHRCGHRGRGGLRSRIFPLGYGRSSRASGHHRDGHPRRGEREPPHRSSRGAAGRPARRAADGSLIVGPNGRRSTAGRGLPRDVDSCDTALFDVVSRDVRAGTGGAGSGCGTVVRTGGNGWGRNTGPTLDAGAGDQGCRAGATRTGYRRAQRSHRRLTAAEQDRGATSMS